MFPVYYKTEVQFITEHQKPNLFSSFDRISQLSYSVADNPILTASVQVPNDGVRALNL